MSVSADTEQAVQNQFEAFLKKYYKDDIGDLATSDRESLDVEYSDLFSFDADLAQDWLAHPDKIQPRADDALRNVDIPVDADLESATVRLTDTGEYLDRRGVATLTVDDIGHYVAVRGQMNRVTDLKPRLREAAWECQRCGVITNIPQPRTSVSDPHECQSCERQGPFRLNQAESKWTDLRKIKLEQPPEEKVRTQGDHLPVFAEGDLVHRGGENGLPDRSGDRITILGELNVDEDDLSGPNATPEGEKYLDARAIVFDEDDENVVDVDAYRDQIDELAERAGDELIEAYRDSIAPTIMAQGDEDLATVLEAFVAYLFNGYRMDPDGKGTFRGDIHMGVFGDPGKGKSTILDRIAALSPKCEFRSGPGMSDAGMTAAATQEEFFGHSEWTLEPGVLPRANGGHCIIDEIDKSDGDTEKIHDALEGEQEIKVDKADIHANLPTRTALCVAGNPVEGRFDRYEDIAGQVDMDPALISRMDGLFALRDIPDPEHDEDVAWHILDSVEELAEFELADRLDGREEPDEAETVDPPIPSDLFRAAIAYAQEEVFPELTPEAKRQLAEFYVDVRGKNQELHDADPEDAPVPATPRKLEAGIRLSMAFARAEFSEDILPRHAKRAIRISKSVIGLNVDPDSGYIDDAMTGEGVPKSQRDRIKNLKAIIDEVSKEYDDGAGAPVDVVIEEAEEIGIREEKARHEIEQLKQKRGEVIEPQTGRVRTV